jgi:GT2 family glycosyltransferase
MKSVSIIIVNWNGGHLLDECLSSLEKQRYKNFEIIVVDNGSTDGSIQVLEQWARVVKVMALSENKGFTGGNIEGLKAARGEYIGLFNNDAVADPNWLRELVTAMDEDDIVGICASKLIIYDQPDKIDSAGDGCVTSGHGIKRGNRESINNFTKKEYVFGACAAAVLYRRKMIEDIGFFDEDFYLNCDDSDLNFRAQLMGWKCMYVPTAVALHRVSATIKGLSHQGVYYSSRNDECVWVKNMPTSLMIRYLHHKLIHELGSIIYFCIKRGKWGPVFKGKLDAIKMLPQLLGKRKEIQRKKRVTNRYLNTVLTPIFDRRMLKGKIKRLFSLN